MTLNKRVFIRDFFFDPKFTPQTLETKIVKFGIPKSKNLTGIYLFKGFGNDSQKNTLI